MDISTLPDLIIFFSAVFAFVLAAGQLALQNRSKNNILLSALLICYGLFQLSNSFSLFHGIHGWQQVYKVLHPLGIVSFFNIGPLQYLYFKAIVKSPAKISKKTAIHFLPGLMSAVFFIISHANGKEFISPRSYAELSTDANRVYTVVAFLSVAIFILYCLQLIRYLMSLFVKEYSKEKKSLRISLYCITALFSLAVIWLANLIMSFNMIKIIHLGLSIYLTVIYILSNRYPQLLHIVKLEAQRDYYVRSQTERLDMDSIIKSLTSLMKNKKLYAQEDLTIKQLASELEITPHQLSEILNQKIGKTFYNYINEMRIEEAKAVLQTESEKNILSIAYDAGFNSTSAFYNAFKKYTGYSPSAYRKKFQR